MLQTIKNIPKRIINATCYSVAGMWSAFKKEEAFRLETIGFIILLLIMLLIPWPLWKKFVMVGVYCVIPLCELVNSAIEDLCDLVTKDYNKHVKHAKDKGSAAVLIAIIINFFTLSALIAF